VRVRWTIPAVGQLQSLFDYIADENPGAAERTVRRIHEATLRTARLPKAGRMGRVPGTREIIVSGTHYLVAYRIVENLIDVLAILDGAQQWPESFKARDSIGFSFRTVAPVKSAHWKSAQF